METDPAPPLKRPQFRIIHFMVACLVFALIFAILGSNRRDWATLSLGIFFAYIAIVVCWVIWLGINQVNLESLAGRSTEECR